MKSVFGILAIEFKFDLFTLYTFLIGIGLGIALAAIIYLLMVLTSFKTNKKYINTKKMSEVTDEEAKEIINLSIAAFKDNNLRGNKSYLAHCKDITFNLFNDIARKFFPNSKHPTLELTIDEALMVMNYITERVDDLLSARGLRFFRKYTISQFVKLTDIKQEFDNNNIVKATKKYKVKEVAKAVLNVINIINPIYWTKKLIVNQSLNIVMKKLCIMVIGIVGEETYKIYSKSVFNRDLELETGIDKAIQEINQDYDSMNLEKEN